MTKKYEFTSETKVFGGVTLHRIRALRSVGEQVKPGDAGGWIESEKNLSHAGNCWVADEAEVYGNAKVYDDAWVYNSAEVYGNAKVYDDAEVYNSAEVYGNAEVCGNAKVYDDAVVYGNARVCGNAMVCDTAVVYDEAVVCDEAVVRGNADYITVKGLGSEYRNTTIFRVKGGGIGVSCGCFWGTLDQFRNKVKETHGDSKYAKEYMLLADMAQVHFEEAEK